MSSADWRNVVERVRKSPDGSIVVEGYETRIAQYKRLLELEVAKSAKLKNKLRALDAHHTRWCSDSNAERKVLTDCICDANAEIRTLKADKAKLIKLNQNMIEINKQLVDRRNDRVTFALYEDHHNYHHVPNSDKQPRKSALRCDGM